MFTITGEEESKTVLYMEQCHSFTKEECETVIYIERCHPVNKQVCEIIHCTERCRDMTIQKVKYLRDAGRGEQGDCHLQ